MPSPVCAALLSACDSRVGDVLLAYFWRTFGVPAWSFEQVFLRRRPFRHRRKFHSPTNRGLAGVGFGDDAALASPLVSSLHLPTIAEADWRRRRRASRTPFA